MNRAPSPRWFPLPSAPRRPAYKPVAADRQAASGQGRLPAIAGANGRGVVEQPFLLLLPGEACKFLAPWVVFGNERFLAVEDRRIAALGVIEHIELPRPQRELDRSRKRRMGQAVKVGIDQVGDLARKAVQFDEIGVGDLAEVRPRAAFVDSQQRLEAIEGRAMHVECIWEEFSDRRISAGSVDCVGTARGEKQRVSALAGLPIRAEQLADIPLEVKSQSRDRRAAKVVDIHAGLNA